MTSLDTISSSDFQRSRSSSVSSFLIHALVQVSRMFGHFSVSAWDKRTFILSDHAYTAFDFGFLRLHTRPRPWLAGCVLASLASMNDPLQFRILRGIKTFVSGSPTSLFKFQERFVLPLEQENSHSFGPCGDRFRLRFPPSLYAATPLVDRVSLLLVAT